MVWVEVWDEDKFKKDDFIGRTAIALEDKDDKEVVDEWRKLEAKYIFLYLTLTIDQEICKRKRQG